MSEGAVLLSASAPVSLSGAPLSIVLRLLSSTVHFLLSLSICRHYRHQDGGGGGAGMGGVRGCAGAGDVAGRGAGGGQRVVCLVAGAGWVSRMMGAITYL